MADEQKQEEKQTRKSKTQKVTLLQNIKYKGKRYKIGEEVEIDSKDEEAFVKSGIIKG